MDLNEYDGDRSISSESSNIANSSKHSSKISEAVQRVHTDHALVLFSSASQMVLGLAVLALCMLGRIQPLWLSSLLAMAASVAFMTGFYLFFSVAYRQKDPNRLIRDAIKRIMDSRN